MSADIMARTIALRICAKHPRADDDVALWVEEHWELVAAQYEAGLISESGDRTAAYSDDKAFAAVEAWYEQRDKERRLHDTLKNALDRLTKTNRTSRGEKSKRPMRSRSDHPKDRR